MDNASIEKMIECLVDNRNGEMVVRECDVKKYLIHKEDYALFIEPEGVYILYTGQDTSRVLKGRSGLEEMRNWFGYMRVSYEHSPEKNAVHDYYSTPPNEKNNMLGFIAKADLPELVAATGYTEQFYRDMLAGNTFGSDPGVDDQITVS